MDFLTSLTATEPATEAAQVIFDPVAFIDNLQYMGIGMVVIFLVIGLIILATKLINYLFSDTAAE